MLSWAPPPSYVFRRTGRKAGRLSLLSWVFSTYHSSIKIYNLQSIIEKSRHSYNRYGYAVSISPLPKKKTSSRQKIKPPTKKPPSHLIPSSGTAAHLTGSQTHFLWSQFIILFPQTSSSNYFNSSSVSVISLSISSAYWSTVSWPASTSISLSLKSFWIAPVNAW